MRRRNHRTRSGPPRVAQRAPGLADWRPVNSFVNTQGVRNVRWLDNGITLVFDAPSQHAEGNWDRWHFEMQRPHDTSRSRLMAIENNVRG
jgi:hypothetical protein